MLSGRAGYRVELCAGRRGQRWSRVLTAGLLSSGCGSRAPGQDRARAWRGGARAAGQRPAGSSLQVQVAW